MKAPDTVLCEECKSVHVPANRQKIRGRTLCTNCRSKNAYTVIKKGRWIDGNQ